MALKLLENVPLSLTLPMNAWHGAGCGSFEARVATQIWDVMTYLVVVVLSLLVFAAYNDRATTGSLEQLCGSFLLLLLYGVAVIPLGYAYSFGFASASAAQVRYFIPAQL